MKLIITHPVHSIFEAELEYLDPMEIQKHIKLYMESRETKHCSWKLNGDAELVDAKDVILYG